MSIVKMSLDKDIYVWCDFEYDYDSRYCVLLEAYLKDSDVNLAEYLSPDYIKYLEDEYVEMNEFAYDN